MPELPTTFGKYFLTEKLATGGMAEIYLAKIVGPGGFEKSLVIKQIHPKLSGQRHFVDLFVAEAKTLVTLAHGNIVPVYELGVVDDTYFIAMDYIDGPTLYRLTEMLSRKRARMEPAVAAWITARILEGLDYAHRKGEGVIHRDLSPRNVMLSRDGEVKLVDFGIAVTLGDANSDDGAQSAPTGSFPYMSPEQVRREQLTGQTDLFSVGVLAWEMLVGERLFARADPEATLRAVTEDDIPRPSTRSADVPAKLDDIVLRALERDKTSRWTDASEMLAALNKYLYGLDDTPGPREVAALVARYCPPETRRVPTHAESLDAAVADASGPNDAPTTAAADEPRPAGPRTAVIPRDGQAPRGRAPTYREQSFATHVQLKAIIERGTPLLGLEAIVDAPATTPRPPPDTDETPPPDPAGSGTKTPRAKSERGDDDASASRSGTRAKSMRGTAADPDPASTLHLRDRELSAPPSRTALILAGLGATALLLGAIWVFQKGKENVLAPDAAPVLDAPFYLAEASTQASDPDAGSSSAITDDAAATSLDAAPAPDAESATRDAGPPVRDAAPASRDAAAPPARDAAIVRPTGTATIVVGANPWGEVYIDGVKQTRRAPNSFTVPAGKHSIEVVFPEDDPPKKKSFTVDLAADGRQEVFADFTTR